MSRQLNSDCKQTEIISVIIWNGDRKVEYFLQVARLATSWTRNEIYIIFSSLNHVRGAIIEMTFDIGAPLARLRTTSRRARQYFPYKLNLINPI